MGSERTFLSQALRFLFFFSLALASKTYAAGEECDSTLLAASLDNVYPGSILRVKVGVERFPVRETFLLSAHAEPAFQGDELEVLEGPKKMVRDMAALSVKVRIVRNGYVGVTFWSWLKDSTVVIRAGPEANKIKRPAKLIIVKFRDRPLDDFDDAKENMFGRPHAKLGDWVWVGSQSRAMKVTNVGKVVQANEGGHFMIKVLAGYEMNAYLRNAIPLTLSEVQEFFSFTEEQIKDRLGWEAQSL